MPWKEKFLFVHISPRNKKHTYHAGPHGEVPQLLRRQKQEQAYAQSLYCVFCGKDKAGWKK